MRECQSAFSVWTFTQSPFSRWPFSPAFPPCPVHPSQKALSFCFQTERTSSPELGLRGRSHLGELDEAALGVGGGPHCPSAKLAFIQSGMCHALSPSTCYRREGSKKALPSQFRLLKEDANKHKNMQKLVCSREPLC